MAVKKGGGKVAKAGPIAAQTVMQRDAQGKVSRTPGALTPQMGRVVTLMIGNGLPIVEACEQAGFVDPGATALSLSKNEAFNAALERRQRRELQSIYAGGMNQLAAAVRSGAMDHGDLIKTLRLIQDKVLPDAKAGEGEQAHGLEGLTIDKLDAAMQALKQANGDAAITIDGLPDSIDDAPDLDGE